MSFRTQPVPVWSSLDSETTVSVPPYYSWASEIEPENIFVVPRGMPTWLVLKQEDLRSLQRMDGTTIGRLLTSADRLAMEGTLSALFRAGAISVGGERGIVSTERHEGSVTRKPRSLLIKMTGACDIACDYCYDYSKDRWDGQVNVDLILELIRDSMVPNQLFTVMFHGGEPLLNFGKIVEITELTEKLASELGSRCAFSIQTNAIRLEQRHIDFFRSHGFSVGISWDGPQEVHDRHRVDHKKRGTFTVLAEKLARFPDFMREEAGYISVVAPDSIGDLEAIWSFFQDAGIRSWKLLPSEPEGRFAESTGEGIVYRRLFIDFLERRVSEIVAGTNSGPFLSNVLQLISPLVSLERTNLCMSLPCGAGSDLLVVDAKSTFRACDCTYHPAFLLQTSGESSSIDSALGHANAAALRSRAMWLTDEAECSSCQWLHFCAGTCPARALMRKNTILAVDDLECETRKRLLPLLLDDLSHVGRSNVHAYWQRSRTREIQDIHHLN